MTNKSITITVVDAQSKEPIHNAKVQITKLNDTEGIASEWTDAEGTVNIEYQFASGITYVITATAFNVSNAPPREVKFDVPDNPPSPRIELSILEAPLSVVDADEPKKFPQKPFHEGQHVGLTFGLSSTAGSARDLKIEWTGDGKVQTTSNKDVTVPWILGMGAIQEAMAKISARAEGERVTLLILKMVLRDVGPAHLNANASRPSIPIPLPVALSPVAFPPTADQALWIAIRNRTKAIAFSGSGYKDFIDRVFSANVELPENSYKAQFVRQKDELGSMMQGVGAYELLKTATQAFLLLECGVFISGRGAIGGDDIGPQDASDAQNKLGKYLVKYLGNKNDTLPYIKRILDASFKDVSKSPTMFRNGYLTGRIAPCLLELIWSYWHEEGMLVQTLNAISMRFQNRRSAPGRDPLAHLEIAPLWPLNNLLWGYIQDEHNSLSVKRRAYEYDHHYGISLYGRAVQDFAPADSRSKFLEAYHNLLHLTTLYYKQADDTTVKPDGFPVLNALREVHLILAQGAHNQFGDLPWTARVEMLMQQWILARPEVRRFLQSRDMVPYKQDWMAPVDTMKQIQGWTDTSVTNFHDLAVYGEQLLLSIRYGDWVDVNDPIQAANWANDWRPEVQGYTHAYRAATGVDLTLTAPDSRQVEIRNTPPSVLLRQRLQGAGAPAALPAPANLPMPFQARRAARRVSRP